MQDKKILIGKGENKMDNEFIERAKENIIEFFKDNHIKCTPDDIFIVWSCKTLQNRKAIMAVRFQDHHLFEVTWNGDKSQMYIDTYDKVENMCVEY